MSPEIVVVSGLPRSGTSLMMQMLHQGGLETMTDKLREADPDNPRGYFEYEPVKALQRDASWMPEARGKAIKVISQLLFSLPATERYAVILMQRDLEEVLASQEAMLARQGRPAATREIMRKAFTTHLQRLEQWLPQQPYLRLLQISYAEVVAQPLEAAAQVSQFLGRQQDTHAMAGAVDETLYRNRPAK